MKNLKNIILTMLFVLLGGCSTVQEVGRRATDYNLSVEKANNEMLLLNIIRAAMRKPMYFTSIGAGSLKVKPPVSSVNLPIKIGGDATNDFSLSPALAIPYESVTFPVTPEQGKEFMQGIGSSLDMSVLKYYWDQGWPKEMLLMLFINKINMNKRAAMDYAGSNGSCIKH